MKKFMVADLIKDLREDQISQIVNEGGVSTDIAIAFLNAGNTWPLDDDNSFQWWVENVREDIETDNFNFEVKPSHSTWRNNMHDNPAKVDANLIYESIGPTGSDTAIFSVDVDWPDNSTDAPRTKTYEMDYNKIQEDDSIDVVGLTSRMVE